MKCWTVNLIAAVWFNSYKRRLNVVTAGQLSSVESSVSYWRPEAVNYLATARFLWTLCLQDRAEGQGKVRKKPAGLKELRTGRQFWSNRLNKEERSNGQG